MDRHSSYIFVWLQLELCAMAVLLTKGGCPPACRLGRTAGSRGRPSPPASVALCQGFVSGGRGCLPRGSPQVATSCQFLEVAAGVPRSRPPPRCPGPGAWRWSQTSGLVLVKMCKSVHSELPSVCSRERGRPGGTADPCPFCTVPECVCVCVCPCLSLALSICVQECESECLGCVCVCI